MPDFLLELLSEEIPARMQAKARDDLARLFEAELAKSGMHAGSIETYSTPRRLALIARHMPPGTLPRHEEVKGPPVGASEAAVAGFLTKAGLTREALEIRPDAKGRDSYFARIHHPAQPMASILAEAIPAIVRAFPWPKSMRWGAASQSTESLRWVRPLQGIVALLGEEIVPFEIDGIQSGAATVGHRFHHPGRITIGSAEDYAAKLRACHVIVDHEEREAIIATGATTVAAQAGLTLVRDEALLRENAGLTEWPVPLMGSFDPSFLEVPPEVIQLTMATNQKYFALLKSSPERGGGPAKPVEGAQLSAAPHSRPLHHQPAADGPPPRAGEDLVLAPNFICTANVDPRDRGTAIVAGNQKVLAARLSDAKFFWEQDLKVRLEDQAKKLDQIVFHEKLGTVADKVERVAKLARWLVEEGIVNADCTPAKAGAQESPAEGLDPGLRRDDEERALLADMAETAARLCKADLVTGMVGEFPELQGVMGGYYARAQGHPDAVADAIRDHYKPVGQGDEVPTAPVTVAVSLADKLDTLMCFFAIGEKPTGSKDPFALRRAALSVIRLVLDNNLRFSLDSTLETMTDVIASGRVNGEQQAERDQLDGFLLNQIATGDAGLVWFFADRLKVQQREAGVRHDLVDAVFALGGEDDLVRLLARVKALQAFVETAEGRDLLAGYKRAANILKKEGWPPLPAREGLGVGIAEGDQDSAAEDSARSRSLPTPKPPPEGGGEV
jgi:glycyl-tRNA synthetase beta chain